MPLSTASRYDFETGVYRPPSEGGSHSLLVRFTRNCPWNHCTFCGMYKTEKFEVRSVAEIKRDIDGMAAIRDDLREHSLGLGHGGEITREATLKLFQRNPELNYHQGFAMVYHWLLSGAKTAFLQDGNSLIMKTDQLVEVLSYLRAVFPTIQRVTTYARSKTLMQKPLADLQAIHAAGLDRVHVGLESGDDTVLEKIRKGATGDVHIQGGLKAKAAGFQLSEYWMPGLGGRALWEMHAKNTAKVLSAIDPHYIRSRPLNPWEGTPIYDEWVRGEFEMLSGKEQLYELKVMVTELNVTSKVCFDHDANFWRNRRGSRLLSLSYEGYKFPDEKQTLLDLIDEGLQTENERPTFLGM
jgi:radical SAM superfamily enzyme YgiQ (UPF0313 family)